MTVDDTIVQYNKQKSNSNTVSKNSHETLENDAELNLNSNAKSNSNSNAKSNSNSNAKSNSNSNAKSNAKSNSNSNANPNPSSMLELEDNSCNNSVENSNRSTNFLNDQQYFQIHNDITLDNTIDKDAILEKLDELLGNDMLSSVCGYNLSELCKFLTILSNEKLIQLAAFAMYHFKTIHILGDAFVNLDPSCRRVMVRGLRYFTSDKTFHHYFSKYGELENAAIIRHADGKSQGFGFLIYKDRSSAISVINHQHCLDDKILTVKFAAERYSVSNAENDQVKPNVDRRKLFIRNICSGITEDILEKEFNVYGPIEECAIIRTVADASKGYGFVTFKDPKDATKAAQVPFRIIGGWVVFVAFSTGKVRTQYSNHNCTNSANTMTSQKCTYSKSAKQNITQSNANYNNNNNFIHPNHDHLSLSYPKTNIGSNGYKQLSTGYSKPHLPSIINSLNFHSSPDEKPNSQTSTINSMNYSHTDCITQRQNPISNDSSFHVEPSDNSSNYIHFGEGSSTNSRTNYAFDYSYQDNWLLQDSVKESIFYNDTLDSKIQQNSNLKSKDSSSTTMSQNEISLNYSDIANNHFIAYGSAYGTKNNSHLHSIDLNNNMNMKETSKLIHRQNKSKSFSTMPPFNLQFEFLQDKLYNGEGPYQSYLHDSDLTLTQHNNTEGYNYMDTDFLQKNMNSYRFSTFSNPNEQSIHSNGKKVSMPLLTDLKFDNIFSIDAFSDISKATSCWDESDYSTQFISSCFPEDKFIQTDSRRHFSVPFDSFLSRQSSNEFTPSGLPNSKDYDDSFYGFDTFNVDSRNI